MKLYEIVHRAFTDVPEDRAALIGAVYDSHTVSRIDFNGETDVFTANLMHELSIQGMLEDLDAHGNPALLQLFAE